MIRAIIVDDEPHAIASLAAQLETLGNVTVVASSGTVTDGIAALVLYNPDLLFLDVELSDQTGFQLLEQIHEHRFDVIFTTAYEQYALQAIKASALDYLMKPIRQEELAAAVTKHITRKGTAGIADQVAVLMAHYQKSAQGRNIALPTQEGVAFVSMDDIIRLEAENNYTRFYLSENRKLVISRTLKEYEQVLLPNGFCRIHNSHIINLRHLDKYFRGDGGYVRMKDGSTADVSRHRKEAFMKLLSV